VRRGEGGGLGGKKWARRSSATWVGLSASGRARKHWGGHPNANLFAVQTECGVAEERKSDQRAFLADAMALN